MTLQVLLTNDDGIRAAGLAALRRALDGLAEVTTIAPLANSSAMARSITIDRTLHLHPTRFGGRYDGIAVDGTPSDCVRIGLLGVAGPTPDLIVSGINLGANLGADVTYSGTVGAALEAALRGKAGIALSVENHHPRWLDGLVPLAAAILREAFRRGLPPQTVLNVNFPDRPLSEIRGVRPAVLGGASCHDRVTLSADGKGRGVKSGPAAQPVVVETSEGGVAAGLPPQDKEYFVPCDPPAGDLSTDFDVVAEGYVALTPLRYDLMDQAALAGLADWRFDLAALRSNAQGGSS